MGGGNINCLVSQLKNSFTYSILKIEKEYHKFLKREKKRIEKARKAKTPEKSKEILDETLSELNVDTSKVSKIIENIKKLLF